MTKSQRAVTLLLAILFLATSVAFTVLVIVEMTGDDTGQPTNQAEENSMDLPKLSNFEPGIAIDQLQVIIQEEGDGPAVKSGDTATFHYTGALASDGSVFDSSVDRGQPFTTQINPTANLIEGWKQGIPGMKTGGKYRLLIPSELGYGQAGSPPVIPANADLVFDIEVLSIDD